jgi:gluconolactonase
LFAARVFAQEFGHLEVQRVVANLHFAEGPVWSYDGFLLFSDTVVDKLFKVVPGSADEVFAERAGGAIGNAYDTEGRLYSCEFRQRRITRTLKNGKVEVLAARFEGKRFNAPNDIVVRRDGQIYFTDPAFGSQQDTRELDFYGVYHITPKGELEVVAKWKTRPNGIALSPNGRTLYVSDSDERNVRAYDLDGKGVASKERIVVDKIDGVPDGLRTDEKATCTWPRMRCSYTSCRTAPRSSWAKFPWRRRRRIWRSATPTWKRFTSRRGVRCIACGWA